MFQMLCLDSKIGGGKIVDMVTLLCLDSKIGGGKMGWLEAAPNEGLRAAAVAVTTAEFARASLLAPAEWPVSRE